MIQINFPMKQPEKMEFNHWRPLHFYNEICKKIEILNANYDKIENLRYLVQNKSYDKDLKVKISMATFVICNHVGHLKDMVEDIQNRKRSSLKNSEEYLEFDLVLTVAEKVHQCANILYNQVEKLLNRDQINSSGQGGGGGSKPNLLAEDQAHREKSLLAQKKEAILKVKREIKDTNDKIKNLEDNIAKNIGEKTISIRNLENFEADKAAIEKLLEELRKSIDQKSQIFRKNQDEIAKTTISLDEIEERLVLLKYQKLEVEVPLDHFISINIEFQEDIRGLKLLEEEIKDETEKLKYYEHKVEQLKLEKINQTNLLETICSEIKNKESQKKLLDKQLKEQQDKLLQLELLINLGVDTEKVPSKKKRK